MSREPQALWRGILLAVLLACLSSPAHAAVGGRGRGRPGGAPPQQPRRTPPGAPASQAPPSGGPEVVTGAGGEKSIAMESYGVDIDHFLRLFSTAAGVTIVKSDQVVGPLTVIAPEPVPIEQAFQILNEVLAVRGFTMVQTATGGYKVVSRDAAMQSPLPLRFGARPEDVPSGEDLITQVIPLKQLDANDMASHMQGLLSDTARVIPTSTNSLIVTDSAGNIQQALTIIARMEDELSGGLRVFPLYHYDATEMAQLVNGLILGRGGAASQAQRRPWEQRVVRAGAARPAQRVTPTGVSGILGAGAGPEFCHPDLRTNSLIVLATPLHQQQIEDLVLQLDRPISLRDTYYVYPVQNLLASELAQLVAPVVDAKVVAETPETLAGAGGSRFDSSTGLLQSSFRRDTARGVGGGAQFRARGARALSAESENPARQRAVEVEPLAGAGGGVRVMPGAVPPGAQPTAPPVMMVAPQPGLPISGGPAGMRMVEEGAQVASGARALIVADDNSNTLLISAPPEQLDLIQQMLEKLDVLPPQVHIRTIIAEVLLTRDTTLGFQWGSLGRTFGTFYDGDRTNVFQGDIGTGFNLGTDSEEAGLSGLFGAISGPEFEAVLQALTTDSHVRILATPSIFTSSNVEASIDVSKNIPFPRSTVEYQTGLGATSTYVDYQSVGIIVKVTPRVTQGDMVRMEISVRSDELGESIDVAGQGYPTTNQRIAQATLTVKHGYTVALGGLMRDTIRRSAVRVPVLGDLPIVGSLFRSTNTKREKSELLVFLTPHVVRTPAEAADLAESEKSRLPEVPRTLQRPASGADPTEIESGPDQ